VSKITLKQGNKKGDPYIDLDIYFVNCGHICIAIGHIYFHFDIYFDIRTYISKVQRIYWHLDILSLFDKHTLHPATLFFALDKLFNWAVMAFSSILKDYGAVVPWSGSFIKLTVVLYSTNNYSLEHPRLGNMPKNSFLCFTQWPNLISPIHTPVSPQLKSKSRNKHIGNNCQKRSSHGNCI